MSLPVIFVGHGSPMNAIESNKFTEEWRKIGEQYKPKAILMISAHWFVKDTYIQDTDIPRVINDMYGFPDALYQVNYQVKGDATLSKSVRERLTVPININNDWGIDHGAWSVLNHMYPNRDIPVVQLSVNANASAEEKYKIGQQLKGFRDEDVLIIGSGNIVHNLSRVNIKLSEPYPWALQFNNYVKEAILSCNHSKCIHYYRVEESAHLSVPISDHYDPLLYVLGATHTTDTITIFNDELIWGSLSMTSYIFE